MTDSKQENTKAKFNLFDFLYKYGTILTIGILIVVFSMTSDRFLTGSNIINILRSVSIVTIIAIGITISLSVGGFDLSAGSVASISVAVVISMFVWHEQNMFVAILVTLGIAVVCGLLNAFMIVKVKIDDMLLTLATMFIFQGVALTYSKGAVISQGMVMENGETATGTIPEMFSNLGKEPYIIIIMFLVVAFVHLFLTYTKHGRYMYMIGGNQEAARLSGISVNKYRVLAYVMSALFAALGGIILGSRVMTAEINAGEPYLMNSVAAAYIGFSVLGSGKANALGTMVGAILIGILENGLVMLSVPYYAMDIVKGSVLAFALALTYYKKR